MRHESTMDQEREAPLDDLDAWIEDDEDELYPVGAVVPTGITNVPPPA